MSKKVKVSIFLLTIILIISLILNIIAISRCYGFNYRIVTDVETGIEYLQTENESYPLICEQSVEQGMFTQDTYERLPDLSLASGSTDLSEEGISLFRVYHDNYIFDNSRCGSKQLNTDLTLYFNIIWENSIGHSFYIEQGFSIPALSSETIESIECVCVKENNDPKSFEESFTSTITISGKEDIENFLNNYMEFTIDQYVTDYYIKYYNYDLEEWFDGGDCEKLNSILS